MEGMQYKDNEDKLAKTFMPAVIRRYREAAGFSQQELADRVGIAGSYLSSLELGYRAPTLNLLIEIARALGVRPGEMIDAMVVDFFEALRVAFERAEQHICVDREDNFSISYLSYYKKSI